LSNKADNLANYDTDEYYDEETGNLVVAKRPNIVTKGKTPPVMVRSHQNPGGKLDRAQFDLNVRRLTNAIAQPVPIALFGTTHLRSGYSQFLIPGVGTTVVVVGGLNTPTAGTTDRIRFTFTNGANVDIVEVTCNQVPYPVFLEALGADIFRISNVRYDITNTADVIQFAQSHKFTSKSLFGKLSEDDITIAAYKKPEQFQPGIVDIPIAANIDKETMLILNVTDVATAYPFNFQLHVFVEKFQKHDRFTM
jgi:hypothetical protein